MQLLTDAIRPSRFAAIRMPITPIMLKQNSAILISHRLSTVRTADAIYENCRIAEQGHHEELMRLGGTYARLFEQQARQYR